MAASGVCSAMSALGTVGSMTAASMTVLEAVRRFRSLASVVSGLDVRACEPHELETLIAGVREGQQALDRLVLLIGVAAERHGAESKGRGAHGTLLGDGRRVRGRTARRETDRARTVATLGRVGAAVDDGRIGAAQVDAIATALNGLSDDEQQLLNTDELVDAAASLSADTFAKHARREAERIKGDGGLADTRQRQARSSWKHWFDERTGMGHVHGEFDPERYEAIIGSVERELTRLANEGGVSKDGRLAADAAYGLLTGVANRHGPGRPHIGVVVDWETFTRGPHDASIRETADGHRLPPESMARLACDAVLQRVLLDANGIPVNVGRRYRTATDAQWQASRAMYRTCAWHGCDRPIAWCQLHHVHEWDLGGLSDLCNLVPLCSRHHHHVHEGGWSVRLHPETRRFDIHTPDGSHHATTWPDRIRPSTARGSPIAA